MRALGICLSPKGGTAIPELKHVVESNGESKINDVRPACQKDPEEDARKRPPREQNSKVIGEVCEVVDPGDVEIEEIRSVSFPEAARDRPRHKSPTASEANSARSNHPRRRPPCP